MTEEQIVEHVRDALANLREPLVADRYITNICIDYNEEGNRQVSFSVIGTRGPQLSVTIYMEIDIDEVKTQ